MATTRKTDSEPLRVLGAPRRLTLVSQLPGEAEEAELALPDALSEFAGGRVVALPVRRRPDGGRLRLRLPRSTPPGSYAAELRIAGQTYPVSIEVAPQPRLRIFPPSAEFAAAPRGTAETTLTVVNEGNVAIEVPERVAIGLFDDEGLETAFADTYRQDTDDPLKLLGHWFGKLREGYGGLLHIHVVSGAGPKPPGSESTVVLKATLREGQRPGHSYHGVWSLGPVNYRINVAVGK
jgi:hypothetical protein